MSNVTSHETLINPNITREREILRTAVSLKSKRGENLITLDDIRKIILHWAAEQIGRRLPSAASNGKSFDFLVGGRNCIGISHEDDENNYKLLWALRVDTPDKNVPLRVWTTEIVLGTTNNNEVLLSLRLIVSTTESFLSITPSMPKFIANLCENYDVKINGYSVDKTSIKINSEESADDLMYQLTDRMRRVPYIICSGYENGEKSHIDTVKLSKSLVCIARIINLPQEYTWPLTKRFGKKLSTYNGGVRVYLPDFSSEDDPYRHNLYILNENCEQENIDSVTDKISWAVSNNSLRTMQLGKEVLDFSAVRNYKIEYDRRCIKVGNDSKDKQLDLARREITELKQALKRADDYSDFYAKEFDTKNHELNALKNKLRNARLRISQLEEKSKNNDSKDIVLPEEWGDKFFQWCEDNLEDRVIFSEMAKRKSKSPKYNDPKTAARCLLWLSRDYWRAKINGKGTALRMTIFDGIKNDQCRAEDRVQIKWKGKNVEAHWHIKNSGNTRDPLRCLRIYYFWDDDDQSIIIVSMPAHAKTSMT